MNQQLIYKLVHSSFIWSLISFYFNRHLNHMAYQFDRWMNHLTCLTSSRHRLIRLQGQPNSAALSNSPSWAAEGRSIVQLTFMGSLRRPQHCLIRLHGWPKAAAFVQHTFMDSRRPRHCLFRLPGRPKAEALFNSLACAANS